MPFSEKSIKVLKFGGTSVGTSEKLTKVSDIILETLKQCKDHNGIVICVSAMSGTHKSEGTTSRLINTLGHAMRRELLAIKNEVRFIDSFHKKIVVDIIKNNLIKKNLLNFIQQEISSLINFCTALVEIREVSNTSRDRVISVGEILSARILTEVVNFFAKKKLAKFINLSNIIPNSEEKKINDNFFQHTESALRVLLGLEFSQHPVLILTGYIGKIPGGIIETIGRGYTDYTASLAASACDASSLEIWKEVDGIFSADPNKMNNASILPQISYQEAAELTFFGTEAIHPRTIEPCIRKQIPIYVKNVLNPLTPGTVVNNKKFPSTGGIGKALTQKKNISIISIESNRMNEAPGFIYRIGEIFFHLGVSIDLMATSEVSVSITVHDIKKEQLTNLVKKLGEVGKISVMKNLAAISIIGHGMQNKIGAAGLVFSAMGRHKINIILISQGASELSISFVVKKEDADNAIKILHNEILSK